MGIIIKPLVTEKMTAITEKLNRFGFIVRPEANKLEIKSEIEALYNVTVVDVNTVRYSGKNKSRYTKTGLISGRTNAYKKAMGVTIGWITIRNQKTRWGSCSSKGNLNFNCLLMLAPPEVLDSVVVHELCHRREMNHSQKFYAEVLRVFPTYRTQEKWLKEHGGELLKRLRD